jgi:four helix bundle protein
MPSQADELSLRADDFAVRTLKFVRALRRDLATDSVARQLARSAPSVSANYRSARRARSRAEFVARLAVVVDEADESEHWLFVIRESGIASGTELDGLLNESRQLRAIFGQSLATARLNHKSTSHRTRRSSKP